MDQIGSATIDPVRRAWAEQQDELADLIDDIADDGWDRGVPRCPGWTVSDVLLHLAQTNEMAIGSATGTFDEVLGSLTAGIERDGVSVSDVDDGAALMVQRDRGRPPTEVVDRWRRGVDDLAAAFDRAGPLARVTWVAGRLSVRTLIATRLAETWIHTGDIGDAIGVVPEPTQRLEHVARLAWRTLPYAFARDGRELSGPVVFDLVGPDGGRWQFTPEVDPDAGPVTTVRGSGADLCLVAARRLDPADAEVHALGPEATVVLELVRTYA